MMTTFRGFPSCRCLKRWLPVYERELQDLEILVGPLRIYQLNGTAPASAGTHTGGAFDILDLPGDVDVLIARQMGAPATWSRTEAQGFMDHIHGILRGCPHNGGGFYQLGAQARGYNGLGPGGLGGPDDGPQIGTKRTWQQGVVWAKARQGARRRRARIARLRAERAKITAVIQRLLNR